MKHQRKNGSTLHEKGLFMGVVDLKKSEKLRNTVLEEMEGERAEELEEAILDQFDQIHSIDFFPDPDIERLLLRQQEKEIEELRKRPQLEKGIVCFKPSGASKCERELFYTALKVKPDEMVMFPYQRRWTRNSSAVHAARQRELLYCEKLIENPAFKVARTSEGLPCWESNIHTVKKIEHKGIPFYISGMMDGILEYRDGSKIGFEFKTKSTTIAQVGAYKMRDAQESHKMQTVAYSLLFGINEFLIVYESVAKDGWDKGADARPDMRAFYVKVTESDRQQLLDKWAWVASQCYAGEVPDGDYSKCIFCPYKSRCH